VTIRLTISVDDSFAELAKQDAGKKGQSLSTWFQRAGQAMLHESEIFDALSNAAREDAARKLLQQGRTRK
jgi:hypothetical protein